SFEEVRGVVDHVLVEWRRTGNQDSKGLSTAATGPSRLLHHGGDSARVAHEDSGFQGADIDAQLEGVSADDCADSTVAQAVLDLAPLVGEVAATIAPYSVLRVADARMDGCRLLRC